MRFKKFLSCLLISSLVNVSFAWAMPGKDPALVALEERTEAGWQKFKHLQQRIIEVTDAREKTSGSSTNLNESMAEMSGPFMGTYLISQEMARTILSIDEVGDISRENEKGTSPVKRLEDVFFKTDGRHFNPDKPMLSPALENAAYWFYHIMFGEGATPSSLVTLNNVLIKRAPYSLFDKFPTLYKKYNMERFNGKGYSYFFEKSIKEGISKTTLDEFKNFFEDSYESFIIQASLGVGNEGLDDFIQKVIKDPRKFNELNKKSLSIHFLASMLLNLSDAKGDNFRVDNGVIIGIDNDRFFAPDIFRQCSHNEDEHSPYELCSSAKHRVGARSIFYCWQDVLDMDLDNEVKNLISCVNPFVLVTQWFYHLSIYDREFNRLGDIGALSKEWFELPELENIDAGTRFMIKLNLVSHAAMFPLSLPQRAIHPMVQRLIQLNYILKSSRDVNHKSIIYTVQPHVIEFYYKVMRREEDINCDQIMGRIYEKYSSSYEDLMLKKSLKRDLMEDINKHRNTTTVALLIEEIIRQISLNEYEIEEQISIVNALGKIYTKVNMPKEAFSESWFREKLLFTLIAQGITHEGLKLLISIGHEINQTDEKNQNLVHKVVFLSKIDLNNAESLLENLKELGANLDLKARGKTEQAGTPLTQAMLLDESFAIPMFNKLIELGAGFDTNYFVAEGFINKNEARLNKDPKFKQKVETLLRRDPKLHWQLSLNKLLPVANDPKPKGVIIKTSNSQERFLSEALEKTMLDKKGNLANQTTYGRRDVAPIKTPDGLYGLYFKSFPELPGVEEQVGRLTRNLLGFGAPYTELVRYKNTPVLLSQAIMGENLQDVLNNKPDILKRLDDKNLSGMILSSILVNPEDGKPDNFVVETVPGNQYKYRLVCVDNDHAFVPAVAKEQKLNWTRTHDVIQVRSVLYCLDQMHDSIHKDIRDLFIKLDPADVLKKWLSELKNVHETYSMLFNANEMKDYFKKKECFLGVPFKENVVPELYQKFLRLKEVIEENENITHLDLLMKLEPLLGKRYLQVLSKAMTVKERFDEVDGVFYSKAMSEAHGTVINSKQVLKSMQIPTKKTVIEELRAGKGHGVLQAIAQLKEAEAQQMERALYLQAVQVGGMTAFKHLRVPKILEEVLEKTDFSKLSINNEHALIKFLKENKLQIRRLHLLASKIIVDGDLKHNILGIGNLTILDIRGCVNLTQNIFYQISQECPGVRKLLAAGIGNKNNPIREIAYNKLLGKESIVFECLERLNISDLSELTSIRITAPKLTILEANNCSKFNFIKAENLNVPNLERLELKNNPIIKEEEIIDLLINRTKIKYYNLEGCSNIPNSGKYKDIKTLYNSIFDELKINVNDKELELSHKNITIIQVIAISSLGNLTTLDLSNNKIEDEGAKALSSLTNLTTLNLWNNQIGDEGAKALSALSKLNILDLSDNKIGDEGAKTLGALANLTYLYIDKNNVGEEMRQKLESMIEQNIAKAPPREEKKIVPLASISKNKENPLIKKSIQGNWHMMHNNVQIILKTLDYSSHEIKEENFNKINFTKSELLTLSINIIQQNINLTNIAGRQLQTLLNYYNQANQELGNTIRRINPSMTASKGSVLSQAQLLMIQIDTNFLITSEEHKTLDSKIKQMQDVMDLINHYLENNPSVCKSIILHTLKHMDHAIYQEDGSLDTNFLNLYSKAAGKPIFIWKEASETQEPSLELFYSTSTDSPPLNGSNFLYNAKDDTLTPLSAEPI